MRFPLPPFRRVARASALSLIAGVLAVAAPTAARATGGPGGAFVIPAGTTVTLSNALISGGAVNDLSWGYQLNGGSDQIMNNNSGGSTETSGPDVTIGPSEGDQTLLVFLRDNTCDETYYSDGTPYDHVTVTGSASYSMDFFDGGGYCESATIDRHESGFNFHVDLSSPCPSSAVAPDAPTNVQAYPGNASAAVSWQPPANDGGAQIESYTVNYVDQSGGGGALRPRRVKSSEAATQLNAEITGLTNGDPYTFTVQATNCAGTGPESDPTAPVTPSADSSAQTIGGTTLTQKTGDTKSPTSTDTTIGAQTFPVGTTGIGTLEELSPGGPLAVRGAVPIGQFCGGSTCIGNVLQAELHDGSLGPNPKGGVSFYKLKLMLDRTLVTGLGTDVHIWYDGNLTDDNDTGGDPTPPALIHACGRTYTGTPCIIRIRRTPSFDLKILVRSSDLDPRMSTSK